MRGHRPAHVDEVTTPPPQPPRRAPGPRPGTTHTRPSRRGRPGPRRVPAGRGGAAGLGLGRAPDDPASGRAAAGAARAARAPRGARCGCTVYRCTRVFAVPKRGVKEVSFVTSMVTSDLPTSGARGTGSPGRSARPPRKAGKREGPKKARYSASEFRSSVGADSVLHLQSITACTETLV